MTVRHHPVKMGALASMESTPSSVSAQTAGRAVCVMLVSTCVGALKGSGFSGLCEQQHRYTSLSEEPCYVMLPMSHIS